MPVRPIELLGSRVLRGEAEEVLAFDADLKGLVRDMFETMYHAEGVGLAGPQIAVLLRVLVIDARNEEDPTASRFALINPRIVEASKATERGTEGCLSIPGVDEFVDRSVSVVVEAQDPGGEALRIEAEGFLARVLQHEIDHLDGVLFIDRLSMLKRELLLKKYKKAQAQAQAEAEGS